MTYIKNQNFINFYQIKIFYIYMKFSLIKIRKALLIYNNNEDS